MKAIIGIFFLLAVMAEDPWIWPLPKEYHRGEQTVLINRNHFKFSAEVENEDLKNAFARYYDIMFQHTVEESSESSINLAKVYVSDLKAELQLGVDESYSLTIPDDYSPIIIEAKTIYGAYHAMETLSQLVIFDYSIQQYVIREAPWNIQDAPRFSHRGILMDTSRHFESLPSIFKLIDSLTYAKINVLHWHITDSQSNPAQSNVAPKWWNGAYSDYEKYTVQDIKDVVEYARQRGIRVVPEMDVPGHEASWCAGYPEVCPRTDCFEPLDPSNENAFNLISDILGEWSGKIKRSGIFYDDFYHMGGDEVDYGCWNTTPRIQEWMKQNNYTSETTYKYFVDRVHKIVMGYQRQGIYWEEVWNHFKTDLHPETIIQTWLNKATMRSVVENKYRVIISDTHTYLDHLDQKWTDVYLDEPCSSIEDEPELEKYVLGGEACMWAETVDVSDLYNTVWPRAGAFAERYWSPKEVNDVEKAKNRFMNFRCLLNRRGIPANPALNNGRQAPSGPGSCYAQ